MTMPDEKMPAETLKALKGSIAKWEAIVAGTGRDLGYHNCPLCSLFAENERCAGCPVSAKSGKSGCWGTPYQETVLMTHEDGGVAIFPASHPRHEESLASAQAELDFLRSLLPEGERR